MCVCIYIYVLYVLLNKFATFRICYFLSFSLIMVLDHLRQRQPTPCWPLLHRNEHVQSILPPTVHPLLMYHLTAWTLTVYHLFRSNEADVCVLCCHNHLKALSMRVALMNMFKRSPSLLMATINGIMAVQTSFMKQKVDWCPSVLHYVLIQLLS